MKTKRFFIGVLVGFATLLFACEVETTEPAGEEVPADTAPVEGWITGILAENAYEEQFSETMVSINRIPHTLDKFLELRDQISHTPQGAVMMMLVAFRIFQQYPVEGMKCLTANCTYPLVVPAPNNAGNYNGNVMANTTELRRKLDNLAYLPFVYYAGANPSNGYTPDGPPYQSEMITNLYSYMEATDGTQRIKLFVKTQGADSPRPAVVKKVGNIYLVTEYSSLYLSPKPLIE